MMNSECASTVRVTRSSSVQHLDKMQHLRDKANVAQTGRGQRGDYASRKLSPSSVAQSTLCSGLGCACLFGVTNEDRFVYMTDLKSRDSHCLLDIMTFKHKLCLQSTLRTDSEAKSIFKDSEEVDALDLIQKEWIKGRILA
jgi:hypothetical protein